MNKSLNCFKSVYIKNRIEKGNTYDTNDKRLAILQTMFKTKKYELKNQLRNPDKGSI